MTHPREIPAYYNSTKEVPHKRAIRTLFGRNCFFFFFPLWFFEGHALSHLHLTLTEVPTCLFVEVFLIHYEYHHHSCL